MDGYLIASVGEKGSGPLQFNVPSGIAISPITGQVYIADRSNHRIQVLNPDLTFSHSFGSEGPANGQFQLPHDIAIDSQGLVYVTDTYNHRIQKYSPDGMFMGQFSTKGSGPGQLWEPIGITIDTAATGLVYVSEGGNHHISVFTSDGVFVSSVCSNIDQFNSLFGLKFDEDGFLYGASVEGQENIQEILMKQLVLCQYLCALSILRTGGHFVCKVFDMFTPFSVGLFYLLYRSFEQVCIFKPVTSRPANSERYVVCRSLKEDKQSVNQYLFIINETIHELRQDEEEEKDILEVVPNNLLQTEPFYTYITDSNDRVKPYYRVVDMISTFGDLRLRNCKGLGDVPTLDVSHDEWFIAPIGVIFCKVLQEPWQLHFSQSSGRLYFFNYKTNKSSFEPPRESISPF
uniref:Cap-specific mRNA (nucleoside-2'-O-)-methyltransferase 1 n=1 Tax=Amphimedon queenslandica TaxID=400682 RepID=A0A1X7T085_AMPQE